MKNYYFTSESVTEGHPDKLCDSISDAVLDACLKQDPNSRVAIETFATNDNITIAGQLTTTAQVNIEELARNKIKEIGFDNKETDLDYRNCKIITDITKQSPDIALGVDVGGAGDQGIMFGYACDETESYMPYAIDMAHKLSKRLTEVRKEGIVEILRPDGKTQVTVEYEGDKPKRIETILISTQHLASVTTEQVRKAVIEEVINKVIPSSMMDEDTNIYVSTIIFLPVKPVSPKGPPVTNLPVGFTYISIAFLTLSINSSASLLSLSLTLSPKSFTALPLACLLQ